MNLGRKSKAELVAIIEGLRGDRSVEFRVLTVIDGLKKPSSGDLALAELALALAREIDQPPAKRSTAQVSKELREILAKLEAPSDHGGASPVFTPLGHGQN